MLVSNKADVSDFGPMRYQAQTSRDLPNALGKKGPFKRGPFFALPARGCYVYSLCDAPGEDRQPKDEKSRPELEQLQELLAAELPKD
jgi:hypothetical protein